MRLWFYVPDYPSVRDTLEDGYARCGVIEWSAEPGRVSGCPGDADVIVRGSEFQVKLFDRWLRGQGIEGLRIEGMKV